MRRLYKGVNILYCILRPPVSGIWVGGKLAREIINVILVVAVIAIMLAGSVSQAFTFSKPVQLASYNTNSVAQANAWVKKVDAKLLEENTYGVSPLEKMVGQKAFNILESVVEKNSRLVYDPLEGKARIVIFYTGGADAVGKIKDIVTVTGGMRFPNSKIGVVYAIANKAQVEELAKLPFVKRITYDSVLPNPQKETPPMLDEKQVPGLPGNGFSPDMYAAVNITGATYAWSLGYNGSGVKIAIVDTGIDMGESDLGPQKVARDAFGKPLLFDADEQGLVLTLNPAVYLGNGTIEVEPITIGNYTGVPFYAPFPAIYMTNTSFVAVVDLSTFNMSYFEYPVLNVTFKVPADITANSTIHFGLIFQFELVGNLLVEYTVPTIFVDYNGDGTFDAAYADLSTTYYLLMLGLYQLGYTNKMPNETLFDMSFADEQPFNYTNPVIARDFTGDGVNDFSLGAVTGAFNDANGLFTGATYSFDWLNDWESTGYIIPGFDTMNGMFFDLLFDWESHGTFCAHVAAGLGKVPRPLGYGQGNYTLPGMAPGAKLGGASALWMGNVIIAELYLSGFTLIDPSTFTWIYTGATQADVISNSWGSSYLLINGYATDADPTSLWEDYITLVSGTVIVHAAGNGGPGFGSVTIPGAATAVITVGAGTEFFYRPLYGYLPGAYGQVVSWSDRGPTEFGYPKPDVIGIGSFAWSVGRTIDGLGNGVYDFDLFSGTSEATPMVAGAVADIIQALRDNGYTVSPFLVKAVIKASADNLGYDGFSQGTGMINLTKAINMILEGGILPASQAPLQVANYFKEAMSELTGLSIPELEQLWASYGDVALYYGVVEPGTSVTQDLYMLPIGPNPPAQIKMKPVELVKQNTLSLASIADLKKAVLYVPGEGFLKVPNKYVVVVGNYVFLRANELPPGSRLLIPVKQSAFTGEITQIDVSFPYKYFDPFGRNGYYIPYFVMGSEVSYWIDYANIGYPVPQETSRIQYDIRGGNAFHVQIGEPQKAFELAKEVSLKYLEEYYGINATNATMMPVIDLRFFMNNYYGINKTVIIPLKVSITNYAEVNWSWISMPSTAQAGEPVPVEVNVPSNAAPGIYEGFIKVCAGNYTTYVPVSVAVPAIVKPGMPAMIYRMPQGTFYDNYLYKGALDQYWRPEVGDWRVFPIVVDNANNNIVGLKIDAFWADPSSDFDLGLIGPGFNFWGVADMNYATWMDAGIVAAKISGIAGLLGLPGVYTYFDYPSKTQAEILAPVASQILDPMAPVTEPGNMVYWLVVHQVFTGSGTDTPVIMVMPMTEYLNTVSVMENTTVTATSLLSMPGVGEALITPIAVLGAPGSNPPQVSILNAYLPGTSVKLVRLYVNATNATPGAYLVVAQVYAPMTPSVIWGFNAAGTQGILVELPFLTFAYFTIIVTP